MRVLEGWLVLSFCSALLNTWAPFLMLITSKLPSGFCTPGIKSRLSTFLPEQREWKQEAVVLTSGKQMLSQNPVDVASNSHPGRKPKSHPIPSLAEPAALGCIMCTCKMVDSTSLRSRVLSLPSFLH